MTTCTPSKPCSEHWRCDAHMREADRLRALVVAREIACECGCGDVATMIVTMSGRVGVWALTATCKVPSCTCVPRPAQSDLCPVCGEHVTLTGETTDGRLIGSCGDAFTRKRWEECPSCGVPS